MTEDLVAEAFNVTKAQDDPEFALTPAAYREELAFRAEHVDSSTLATTPFEIEYKKLSDEAKEKAKGEKGSPLGTVATLAEARNADANKTEKATKAKEKSDAEKVEKTGGEPQEAAEVSDALPRAELDKIAADEFGFNPSDYSNKQEIADAINKARAEKAGA